MLQRIGLAIVIASVLALVGIVVWPGGSGSQQSTVSAGSAEADVGSFNTMVAFALDEPTSVGEDPFRWVGKTTPTRSPVLNDLKPASELYALIVAEAYGERFVGSYLRPNLSVGASEEYGLMVAEAYGETLIGSGPKHSSVHAGVRLDSEEYAQMVIEGYGERLGR
jgi:hypothetical protein